jgi:hypothetical protein
LEGKRATLFLNKSSSGRHDVLATRKGVPTVHLVRQAYEFEYRDQQGVDRLGQADVWANAGGDQAVLVLKNVDGGLESGLGGDQRLTLLENARLSLERLASSLLPFLVPRASLGVWVLCPWEVRSGDEKPGAEKPRALVLT